jgi:hypothetical protein
MYNAGSFINWNTNILIWAAVFCEIQRDSLVHDTGLSETENLLQPAILSQAQTVQCRLLCYLQHRQSHSLSYSYCSHQWHSVSCSCVAVVLYWVFLKTGSISTSEMLWFSVDKLGNVSTSMFGPLQSWCCRQFVLFLMNGCLMVCCVHSTVVNTYAPSDCSSSSLQLSAINVHYHGSTCIHKLLKCQIAWKSSWQFSSSDMDSDRQSNVIRWFRGMPKLKN